MSYLAGKTEEEYTGAGIIYNPMPRLDVPIWENWNSEKVYLKGDKVYYPDTLSSYVCIKDMEVNGILVTDTQYWQIIAGGSDWSNLTNEIVVNALGYTPPSIEELGTVEDNLDNLAGVGRTTETVKGNADDILTLDGELSELAGVGRTAETVKGNADNILTLDDELSELAGVGRTTETVKGNADDILTLDGELSELAGVGRTAETVKGNADNILILNGEGEIQEKANKTLIGILSNLTTLVKTSIVNAINSLKGELDEHKADLTTDADGAHGLKIEVGTWTPTLKYYSQVTPPTWTTNKATYTKIGNKVSLYLDVNVTNIGSGSVAIQISGSPFPPTTNIPGLIILTDGNTTVMHCLLTPSNNIEPLTNTFINVSEWQIKKYVISFEYQL